jgi:hypothetical protein
VLQVRIVPRDVRKKRRPRRTIRRILDAVKIALADCQSTLALPQHRLYFLPEPQGHGSLNPALVNSHMSDISTPRRVRFNLGISEALIPSDHAS